MNEDEIKEAIKIEAFNLKDKDLKDDWEHFKMHCDKNNPIDKLVLLQCDNMKEFNPHLLRGIYLDVWKAALRSLKDKCVNIRNVCGNCPREIYEKIGCTEALPPEADHGVFILTDEEQP